MNLAELLNATTADLLRTLDALVETIDPGVTDDVFDRRGLTFDEHWQTRVRTLEHEDVAILIRDLGMAAPLSAWVNSLEAAPASLPETRTPIAGVKWRWSFEVYSIVGRRVSEIRVSAETEIEAVAIASQRIDFDRVLGRAIPYRAAFEN